MDRLYKPQDFNIGDKVYISYVYGKTRSNTLIDPAKSGIYIARITAIDPDSVHVKYYYGGSWCPTRFYFNIPSVNAGESPFLDRCLLRGMTYNVSINLYLSKDIDEEILNYNNLIDMIYEIKSRELYKSYVINRKTYPQVKAEKGLLEKF